MKYDYTISEEKDGDYRIVKSLTITARDRHEADDKADEALEEFKDYLNIQAE